MRVFYPPRVENRLKLLRIEGWNIGRQVAEPLVSIVMYRDGVAIPGQEVVLTYLTSGGRPFSSSHTNQSGGAIETISDVRMSRPILYGFNVETGDRFVMPDGVTGSINQVTRDKGRIWASGAYDPGSP